ncbi:MAG: hypothetical protein ABSB90_06265 [Thermoplasmata archaeon]|jgi:hypothetical protein
MTNCTFCPEPSVAYLQVFQGRKKTGSYPVCVRHAAWGYGFQEIGQDWARTALAEFFGVKKGKLPRVKVSLTP